MIKDIEQSSRCYDFAMIQPTEPAVGVPSGEPLAMLLVSTGKQIADQIKPAFDAEGMRWRHVEVLALLAARASTTQQQLIEAMDLDPSSLVGLLNELETAGAVRRVRDPQDRRRHLVEATTGGSQVLARVLAGITVVEQTVLAVLTDEEQRILRRLLTPVRHRTTRGYPDTACDKTDEPGSR